MQFMKFHQKCSTSLSQEKTERSSTMESMHGFTFLFHGRHRESFVMCPFISKARKARALDIWESLKPDVEQEMARCGVLFEADMYAICFKGWGPRVFSFK